MTKRRLLITTALVFWTFILAIRLVRALPFLEETTMVEYISRHSVAYFLDTVTFSLFYFLLVPAIIDGKFRAMALCLSLIFWGLIGFVWAWGYMITGLITDSSDFYKVYESSLGHTALHTLYAVVLYLAVDWYFKKRKGRELEAENLLMKTNILKTQLNSHFLYNALNNIHALTQSDNRKASEAIITLSEILRYMLHDANQNSVSLEDEIQLIQRFLGMQKLRLKDPDCYSFEVNGDTQNILIAPLMFVPFIENAFKHGAKTEKQSIRILLDVTDRELKFHCSNFKALSKTSTRIIESGIGLKNIRNRLNLIYGQKQKLTLSETPDKFIVDLSITLI